MAEAKRRDYEVSIWTLQDEFISVLKPTGVVNKGQIENPNLKIVDDGTQEFSFSIPMYIYIDGKRMENPIWKNTRDGNVIEDMRKIKVTFNRSHPEEKTFEFLITDVTERHEKDQLYCDVNCEGMAFHELGKRGYSINLLSEDFYLENEQYFNHEFSARGRLKVGHKPVPTLSYWLDKFLPRKPLLGADPRTWYYKIEMDWSSYANGANRKTDEIYEEEYVAAWKIQKDKDGNDVYAPSRVETQKVKERLVDLKESNIYNLTQDLAQTFGVFCRYEYEHDDNLEITGRTIVFYNNYMRENEGYIDITYPFETAAITRTRDSKDLTTKMFVTKVDDESTGNVLTIMDVDANKSREEYIYNFDYLYSIGGISAEQYQEIAVHEAKLGELNIKLANVLAPQLTLQNEITDLEAEITIRENSIAAAKEAYSRAVDEQSAITGGDNTVEFTSSNPKSKTLAVTKDNVRYIEFSELGVLPESIAIYAQANKDRTNGTITLSSKLSGIFEFDGNTGFVNKVNNIDVSGLGDNVPATVYVCYAYNPYQYYTVIQNIYATQQAIDESARDRAKNKLTTIQNQLKNYQRDQEQYLEDKQNLIKKFDDMMGAAIRESYWQPENYNDYGDNYTDNLSFNKNATIAVAGASGLTEAIWDTEVFQEEQVAYYQEGIGTELSPYYYPVIQIPDNQLSFVMEHYNELSVMFYDVDAVGTSSSVVTEYNEKNNNLRQYTLGSTAQFCFVKKDNNIVPAIIVTGAAELIGGRSFEDDNNLKGINSLRRFMGWRKIKNSSGSYFDDSNNKLFQTSVGIVTTKVVGGKAQYTIQKAWTVGDANGGWINRAWNGSNQKVNNVYPNERYTSETTLYYPRIKVKSLSLKTSEDQLGLSFASTNLTNNEDYYILSRDDSIWNNNKLVTSSSSYYITLKPETIMRLGGYLNKNISIKFCISNANVSIYLDALQVMKENSQPKVSYTVDASFIDTNFIYNLYDKLNRICNINDNELHFENVQGYISEIDLDCDIPSNDKIEVKNYKTKFEDLFSTIVAQTQSMKKNEYAIGLATSAFTVGGDLSEKVFESSWRRADLNYAFNQGKLTINEADGIWGTSNDGVVAFRGGGIFTATKKDDLGNWIWNTGILPQGINADLITTGRLDTNKINIYSGDNVRFQFNADGIFAYRDYIFTDPNYATSDLLLLQNDTNITTTNSDDTHQFVTLNQEGLFLVAEEGAKFLVKTDIKNNQGVITQTLNVVHTLGERQNQSDGKRYPATHINRVSVSWDGFTIRDWSGDKVFYADTYGDLTVKGHIQASSLTIQNQSVDTYISQVAQKGVYYGSEPSTSNDGDIWYDTTSNYNKVKVNGHWVPFSYMGGTFLSVNTDTGIIQLNGSNKVEITATNNAYLACGADLYLYGGKSVNIMSGNSTTGTAAITLNGSNGITLTGKNINMNGSGGINLNSANNNITMIGGTIDMTGGSILLNSDGLFEVRTGDSVAQQTAKYFSISINGDNGISIDGTAADFNLPVVADSATITEMTVTTLNVDTLNIKGTSISPGNGDTQFSNKKIIFTENGNTQPTGHDIIWIYPTTNVQPVTPSTDETITWNSGTITQRAAITSGSHTSSAINFSGTTIGSGDSYSYTAKIKIYGTKNPNDSSTRKIKTGSTLVLGNITLTLSKAVDLNVDSEKTLIFTYSGTTKINGSSQNGTITLQTEGGTYVNLQRNKTNTLTIVKKATHSSSSSALSTDIRDCVVKYIV